MFTTKTPWIILLLLWMGGSTWWHVCKIKQLCGDTAPTSMLPLTSVAAPPLTIADGTNLNLNVPGQFSFAKAGAVANEKAVGNTLQSVADYLKANPGRMLTLTGYYHAEEAYTGPSENLGVARAEDIKTRLVKLGVPAGQLATKGEVVAEPDQMPYNAKGDSLYGGLAFAFGEPVSKDNTTAKVMAPAADTTAAKPKTENALAEAEKYTSVFEPIDLYFVYAKPNYIETDDTQKFFDEAETYLKAHKDKKLVLTGHTDNEGSDAENIRLSRLRANAVKKRLVSSGISSSQIDVVAKGESDPKASNATESGRKANRRVTVVVQ